MSSSTRRIVFMEGDSSLFPSMPNTFHLTLLDKTRLGFVSNTTRRFQSLVSLLRFGVSIKSGEACKVRLSSGSGALSVMSSNDRVNKPSLQHEAALSKFPCLFFVSSGILLTR